MRLEWLDDILAISETGSFSLAAERRRLTQSAFSRRVQQIEDYVGVELFDRSKKPIRPRATTLAQCEQMLVLASSLRQLQADLRRGDRMTSKRIVVACQHSLTTIRLPAILCRQAIVDQGIHVRLRSANLDECTGLLLARHADVAIVYRLPDEPGDFNADFLEVMTIGSDRLLPVFNRGLAGSDGRPKAELPCVAYPSDVFFGKVMERKVLPFLDPDLIVTPRVETALTLAALEMAAAGVGVAWVPQSLAQDGLDKGRLVDLSRDLPGCDLQIEAMRLEGSPTHAGTVFWAQLRP